MQSGQRNTKEWLLERTGAQGNRSTDGLDQLRRDTMQQVQLHFATLEEAKAHREERLALHCQGSHARHVRPKAYADNFAFTPRGAGRTLTTAQRGGAVRGESPIASPRHGPPRCRRPAPLLVEVGELEVVQPRDLAEGFQVSAGTATRPVVQSVTMQLLLEGLGHRALPGGPRNRLPDGGEQQVCSVMAVAVLVGVGLGSRM